MNDLTCNRVRSAREMAQPRTCIRCGLGPCRYQAPPATVPDRLVLQLQRVARRMIDLELLLAEIRAAAFAPAREAAQQLAEVRNLLERAQAEDFAATGLPPASAANIAEERAQAPL